MPSYTYEFTYTTDPELGEEGIVLSDRINDGFNTSPINSEFTSRLITHDLLEHPLERDCNISKDELMAIGGAIALRWDLSLVEDRDIQSDIMSYFEMIQWLEWNDNMQEILGMEYSDLDEHDNDLRDQFIDYFIGPIVEQHYNADPDSDSVSIDYDQLRGDSEDLTDAQIDHIIESFIRLLIEGYNRAQARFEHANINMIFCMVQEDIDDILRQLKQYDDLLFEGFTFNLILNTDEMSVTAQGIEYEDMMRYFYGDEWDDEDKEEE